MSPLVTAVVAACGSVIAAYASWLVLRRRRVDNVAFYLVAVTELALLAVLVGGFVALARTSRDVDGLVFGAYLVVLAGVLPLTLLWGVSDTSRWGPGTVAIGGLVVVVLALRLLQIWVGLP